MSKLTKCNVCEEQIIENKSLACESRSFKISKVVPAKVNRQLFQHSCALLLFEADQMWGFCGRGLPGLTTRLLSAPHPPTE